MQKIALIEIDAVYFYYLSIFCTSYDDFNINETSSYVDLVPLYRMMQNKVRTHNSRELLHPNAFAEGINLYNVLLPMHEQYRLVKQMLSWHTLSQFYNPKKGNSYICHMPCTMALTYMSSQTKHIDVHHHFTCQNITDGFFTTVWIPTSNMTSDIFTKPLSSTLFLHHCEPWDSFTADLYPPFSFLFFFPSFSPSLFFCLNTCPDGGVLVLVPTGQDQTLVTWLDSLYILLCSTLSLLLSSVVIYSLTLRYILLVFPLPL